MTNAKSMTSDQAKAYLIKLQEETKQRQQDYVKRKKQAGLRRINTFISSEAADVLDHHQSLTGRTIGEVLSDALLAYTTPMTKPKQNVMKSVSGDRLKTSPFEGGKIETRMRELAQNGMGPTAIADKLNEEGMPTSTGGKWLKGSVHRAMIRYGIKWAP